MFAIERLDTQGVPKPALTLDRVAWMLEEAADQVEGSIEYWNNYQRSIRSEQTMNRFGPPSKVPEGVRYIDYCHAFIDLDDDDAFPSRSTRPTPPTGTYRSTTEPGTRASMWPTARPASTNKLAHHSTDGAIRIVIAGSDPGVPNWIDTEARGEVMATMRWWHAPTQPSLKQEVVKLTDLRRSLPDHTPQVDTEDRDQQMRRRAAHVAWRFHT